MFIFEIVCFFVFGLIFGSFGNVVIHRLPLDKSVVRPRSQCPSCNTQIKWYDNIPVFSWVLLKGRCRECQIKISWRYPLVEVLMGVAFVLCYLFAGWSVTLVEWILFSFALIVSSFIDFDHMILPDELTLSGIVFGLIGATINPDRTLMSSIIGVLIGGGFLWLMAYLYYLFTSQEGMGGGDIKLLAWMGAVLGWQAIPFCIMFSAIVGSIVGVTVSLRGTSGLKTVIPFGPYLALSSFVYMFGGVEWAKAYLGLFLPDLI